VIHARCWDGDRRAAQAIERDALFGVAGQATGKLTPTIVIRKKALASTRQMHVSQEHIDSWWFLDDAWSRQRRIRSI
jgi:hypothetical protein